MAAWVMLATVWTVGVPFYLRFLMALYKEIRHVEVCYLVRIQPSVREVPLIEQRQEKILRARVA